MPVAITAPHLAAAIVAAIWAAVTIWLWRRIPTERKVISALGVIALALFASGALSGLPRPEELLEDVSDALGKWTYLLVGGLAFLETGAFIGLVAPGEAAVIVGGVVAGQGEIDIRLLIPLVWTMAYLGDTASFLLGRKLGRGFLERHGPKVQITEERLVQVEKYMRQHGGKTILIGRFIGLVRALAPFIAGASKMPYRRFLPYDVIGSGLWAAAFCMLGYVFSQNLEAVIHYAERGVLIFGWLVGVIVLTVYLVRRFRQPEERRKFEAWLDRQEQHPRRRLVARPARWFLRYLVIPAARIAAPNVRFAWNRLTPGELGIEFTSAVAITVVAGYGFYFLTAAAFDWPHDLVTNDLNRAAFDVADRIRTTWLEDVASVVTELGRLSVVAGVVALATAICLRRKRFVEAFVLAGGLALAVAVVQATKSWTDVPRPPAPLVETDGMSFPSGHAAYAVSYVTVALTLERVGGVFGRVALVTLGVALGGAVALSRVYLRAHYLTDAIGGTAVGFMTAGLLAIVALLVSHVHRHRPRSTGPPPDAARVADSA